MIINAENLILGRLASYVAKQALLGEEVVIVNCEKAVITGSKKNILEKYKRKRRMGDTFKGPFFPRMPDRLVRRSIRGMLTYKKDKGSKAFKRIMCYISLPDRFKDEKLETIESANIKKLKNLKFMNIKTISMELGKRIEND